MAVPGTDTQRLVTPAGQLGQAGCCGVCAAAERFLVRTRSSSGDDDHWPPRRRRRTAVSAVRYQERGVHITPEHAEGIGAPADDHGVVPTRAERAEERHVGFVERPAGRELLSHL